MIYDPVSGIKANPDGITKEAESLGYRALDFFKEKQADAVIVGCTELSLMRTRWLTKDILIVDATEALALALIREAINYQKNML
jgi:aspartate racemase